MMSNDSGSNTSRAELQYNIIYTDAGVDYCQFMIDVIKYSQLCLDHLITKYNGSSKINTIITLYYVGICLNIQQ